MKRFLLAVCAVSIYNACMSGIVFSAVAAITSLINLIILTGLRRKAIRWWFRLFPGTVGSKRIDRLLRLIERVYIDCIMLDHPLSAKDSKRLLEDLDTLSIYPEDLQIDLGTLDGHRIELRELQSTLKLCREKSVATGIRAARKRFPYR